MHLLLLLFLIVNLEFFLNSCASETVPPIITSIVPSHGGTEGGTRLTVYGYNFAQNGIFSQYSVFIDNQPCYVINYYSTDGQIVCLTPKCTSSFCQDSTWQGYHAVSLDIFVQTVETIVGASSTFTFDGSITPEITRMSHYSWGTATSYIAGKITAAYLDDVSIFIGGGGNIGSSNAAYIGDGDDFSLNPELWDNSNYNYLSSTDYPIYYRPPTDMAGGAYNLSLVVQDRELVGWGSGSARTFPVQYPLFMRSDYRHQYLYDSMLSGTAYNLILFPTISKVFPSRGSVAGGTLLTILGSGFNPNTSMNIVYAAGQRCNVLTADFNTLICQTSSVENSALSSFLSSLNHFEDTVDHSEQKLSFPSSHWKYNTTRRYGSAGWWVRLWDWNSYQTNRYHMSNVRVSFGLHQGMQFGLSYDVGGDWPSKLGYSSANWNWAAFVADYSSLLVAPFTGNYFFYIMDVSDSASLFGAKYSVAGPVKVTLLVSSSQSSSPTFNLNYQSESIEVSSGVYLTAGERFYLRARVVNYGGSDNIHLAMRIDPQYINGTRYLADGSSSLPEEIFSPPLTLSDSVLQHHSIPDIQVIYLSMNYQLEIQVDIICYFFDKIY